MVEPPDSPEVQGFMVAFQRLRNLVDSTPEVIAKEALDNRRLRDLCLDVRFCAITLKEKERSRRELFVSSTNPAFIAAWRDYELNYSGPVGEAASILFTGEGFWDDTETAAPSVPSPAMPEQSFETRWKETADAALRNANQVNGAIEEARIAIDAFPGDSRDYENSIQDGIAAWNCLADEVGFDLAGVFRRRDLTPFIMIPRHVSRPHGTAEPLSLLTLLQQAQEAVIYGVPFAAIALMRAILEVLLKENYCGTGTELSELINTARALPQTVPPARLHSLRKLANNILHFNKPYFTSERTSDLAIEREIISHLSSLQTLIEQAPQAPTRR